MKTQQLHKFKTFFWNLQQSNDSMNSQSHKFNLVAEIASARFNYATQVLLAATSTTCCCLLPLPWIVTVWPPLPLRVQTFLDRTTCFWTEKFPEPEQPDVMRDASRRRAIARLRPQPGGPCRTTSSSPIAPHSLRVNKHSEPSTVPWQTILILELEPP
jgi:hypothetical protein